MNVSLGRYMLILTLPWFLVLGACSDFDEMKSQKLYSQAERLLEQGQDEEAEALFNQVLAEYPRTQKARLASEQIDRILKERARQERQEFARVLDSYQQVFNGYYSVYADYPKSLEEFDASGFFFDSDYLAEITGDGFQVYLWFSGDRDGFRAWCIKDETGKGYAITGRSLSMAPFDPEKTMDYLEKEFHVSQQVGRIHILSPRS
ncbi:MAG: hypothetical protein JRE16_02350 [Deltaproteobacteria bacterium]|jgi:hypothetical protein|nr:hypothetical protein [Deltaproteobacteria bacterium]MBW2503388.1 hypothetical protein [Deltaproteobacteria bacterium]